MNKKELEMLNEILRDYIYAEDFYIEDFLLVKKLSDFVLKNYIKIDYKQKYNNKIGINTSYNYTCDFLSSLSERYAEYFKKRWNKNIFILNKNSKNDIASTYYDEKIADTKIYIPVMNTIQDSYSIVHEIIHDMNLKGSIDNPYSFHILCESLSLLSEFLFEDYYSNDIKLSNDLYKNKREIFFAIIYKACTVDFEFFILNTYQNNGYISNSHIHDYVKNKPEYYQHNMYYALDNILVDQELRIDIEQRNIIGIFVASYMHDRIISSKKNIQEFIEFNDNINYMDLYDIFKYLDLEVKDMEFGELSNNSYKKLFKSYKNEIFRMR